MQIDAMAVLTAGGMILGGFVWLIRLEGRINVGEARFEDLKSTLNEVKQDVKALLGQRK